ncbi:MAG: hypothetical protein SWK90_14405 [Chloroflexota bacterium]|nr:hypothetical protein [Chloroflexota bacterium]
MNAAVLFITYVYTFLVRLYPRDFRAGFEEEMCTVFTDAIAEAAMRGGASLASMCWREVRDWLRVLLSEYWLNVRMWHRGMARYKTDKGLGTPGCGADRRKDMFGNERIGKWRIDNPRQALVAALPPLLFSLGIALSWQVIGVPWHTAPPWRLITGVVVGLAPAAVIAIGGLIALVRRLPDWGYVWVGAAMMGLVLLLKVLAEERAEVGVFLISPVADIIVMLVILLAGLVVLSVAALRGWPHAGLMSIGLAATLGLSLFQMVAVPPFYRLDVALLSVPLGLLVAALTYVYARGADLARIAVLVGVELVNVGIAWAADRVWHDWLLARGQPSPLLPLLVLLTGALLAGPLLGLLGRPLRGVLRRAWG